MISLLSLLFASVNCGQLKSVDPEIKTLNLGSTQIDIAVNQKLIYHFKNRGVYDTTVYDVTNGVADLVPESHELYNGAYNDFDEIEYFDVCQPYKRSLAVEQVLEMEIFADTSEVYISDMMVSRKTRRVLIVTDTLQVFEIKISYKDLSISSSSITSEGSLDLRKHIQPDHKGKVDTPKFFQHPSGNYVFTKYGIARLGYDDKGYPTVLQVFEVKPRKIIHDVHGVIDTLFVAVGHAGVDIYKYSESNVEFIRNINSTSLGDSQMDINAIDVSSDRDNRYIIVLDSNNGILFFEIEPNTYEIQYLFNVHFARVVAFNHFGDTFIVVAETVNKIQYVAEIFIDIAKKQYFFNRIYIEDTSFNKVLMTETYAILISEDDHLVIEHSIYNRFVPITEELVSSFEEEDLIAFAFYNVKYEALQSKNKYEEYYIGIAKGTFKTFVVTYNNPGLICQFAEKGEYKFQVHTNASTCSGGRAQSLYEQCQMTQEFVLSVKDPLFESDKYFKIVAVIASVIGAFIILLCLAFFCNRRWTKELIDLKNRLDEQKRYANFNEVEANSMVKEASKFESA